MWSVLRFKRSGVGVLIMFTVKIEPDAHKASICITEEAMKFIKQDENLEELTDEQLQAIEGWIYSCGERFFHDMNKAEFT